MSLKCLECGGALMDNLLMCPQCSVKNQLIIAVQMAYRKHVLNDDTIGWSELEDKLQTVLAEALGDRDFQQWLRTVGEDHDHHTNG